VFILEVEMFCVRLVFCVAHRNALLECLVDGNIIEQFGVKYLGYATERASVRSGKYGIVFCDDAIRDRGGPCSCFGTEERGLIRGSVLNKTGECGGAEEGIVAIEDEDVGVGVQATIPAEEEDWMFIGRGGEIRSNHNIIIIFKPPRGFETKITRKGVVDKHINNHIWKGFEDGSYHDDENGLVPKRSQRSIL